MTNRERTRNILHFQSADRMPAVHFGYWEELLPEWVAAGEISAELAEAVNAGNNEARRELDERFGWDFCWGDTNYRPLIDLMPTFERQVLETLADGSQRVLTGFGVIERYKPGVVSIPSEDDYLLKDREAFETLFKPKMQFTPERADAESVKKFNETRPADVPIGLYVGSVLGDIRSITTVAGMSYLLYDEDEELFADIVDTYAEMQYQCVKAVLEAGIEVDYGHFWEDICFKSGPLVSPAIFDELCAKHYKKRCDLLRQYGIDIVSLDCDGVTDKLLPTWVNNGVNTMFPIEVGVWGDQFEAARGRFGQKVLGVGGMDKTVLRRDRAAVDAELARLQRLAALGGFIPCPDHRLMPGTKFELVQYYAEKVKEIKL